MNNKLLVYNAALKCYETYITKDLIEGMMSLLGWHCEGVVQSSDGQATSILRRGGTIDLVILKGIYNHHTMKGWYRS